MLEYMVLPEQDGMRLRDVLRRVMGVSYTAMKSAKWNGGITVDDKGFRVLQNATLAAILASKTCHYEARG